MSEEIISYKDNDFYSNYCEKCSTTDKNLIKAIKGSDVFKKSMAISEAMNFLLHKIKVLEKEKNNCLEINNQLEARIQELEEFLDSEKQRFSKEKKETVSLKEILEERNESLMKLNENNKQYIVDMEKKLFEDNLKYKNFIDELNKDVQLKENVIKSMKKKLDSLMEKDGNHNYDLINIKLEYEENLKKNEKELLKIKQDFIFQEKKYRKIIKELELLIYRLNFENLNLKDKLESKYKTQQEENKCLLEEKINDFKNNLSDKNLNFIKDDEKNNNIRKNQEVINYEKKCNLQISFDVEKEIENIEILAQKEYEQNIKDSLSENKISASYCKNTNFSKEKEEIDKNNNQKFYNIKEKTNSKITKQFNQEKIDKMVSKDKIKNIHNMDFFKEDQYNNYINNQENNLNVITSNSIEDEIQKFYNNIYVNNSYDNQNNNNKNSNQYYHELNYGNLETIKENLSNENSKFTNINNSKEFLKDKEEKKRNYPQYNPDFEFINDINFNEESNQGGYQSKNKINYSNDFDNNKLNSIEICEYSNNQKNLGSFDGSPKKINISYINNSSVLRNSDQNVPLLNIKKSSSNTKLFSHSPINDPKSKFEIDKSMIDHILREISITNKIIKDYSEKLNSIELTEGKEKNIQKSKELMEFLEKKTEYLFDMKRQYNNLYSKLNS